MLSMVSHALSEYRKNLPAPSRMDGSLVGSVDLSRIALYVFSALALSYFAFQKHLLPDPLARVASKLFFFPTFPITALLRVGNYWTVVDETLIMGCAPMSILNHPSILEERGVKTVINMCYEYAGPRDYEKFGIRQLHLPTLDHTEVSLDYINKAIACINDCKKRGEKVLVHCKAGNGRAASIALCWMMHENKDKTAKVTTIGRARSCLFPRHPLLFPAPDCKCLFFSRTDSVISSLLLLFLPP